MRKHWNSLAESVQLLGRLLQVSELQQTSDDSESVLFDKPPLNFHVKQSVKLDEDIALTNHKHWEILRKKKSHSKIEKKDQWRIIHSFDRYCYIFLLKDGANPR